MRLLYSDFVLDHEESQFFAVDQDHSLRIETAARERGVSPNQLVIDLAIETLERCEWPRTESEMKVARASLFAAQALARDLIANGREHEVQ